MINTDSFVYYFLIDPIIHHFEHVHPNVITLMGIPFMFSLYLVRYSITNPLTLFDSAINFAINSFVMFSSFAKIYIDCLDGAVARKYDNVQRVEQC